MPIILNIETSTKVCSVNLAKNGVVLASKEHQEEGYSHSEKLTVFIQELLVETGILMNEIDAVAISEGPGSYTGLRIGTSTAKGICFGIDAPLITIPTLQVLANQYINEDFDVIVPMLDARRMEVFTSVFDRNLELIEETHAHEIDENSFQAYTDKKVLFVGDGSFKMKNFLKENWKVIEGSNISSSGMSRLSNEKFESKNYADLAYFEPFYLKDFVAGKPKKWF